MKYTTPQRGFTPLENKLKGLKQPSVLRTYTSQGVTRSGSLTGFALLIAVILSSVALSIGVALLDIAYKQVILASSTKQSQVAFYNADSIMECALYWDQQQNAFSYASPLSSITCNTVVLPVSVNQAPAPPNARVRTFVVPCAVAGQSTASTTVYKWNTGATDIFSSGFNVCDPNNPRRIERGLKSTY